jgi:hypothetical protein
VGTVNATETGVYADPEGWSLVYPREMHVERSAWTGRHPLDQVTVASFALRTAVGPTGNVDPPLDPHGRFPEGAVAFRLMLREGYPLESASLDDPDSSFPIDLETFVPSEYPDKNAPPSVSRSIHANGRRYRVIAWIAPEAPRALRARLGEVVRSVSFRPLLPGTVVGSGFAVLERDTHYPVGSFTSVHAGGLPFVLVHAPGGFYALGWNWSGPPGGYRSSCRPRVDEQRKELCCADCGARWDRLGMVITRPPTADEGDPLHLSVAKVAWDGHVMLHPGAYQLSSPPTQRRFWPDWRGSE